MKPKWRSYNVRILGSCSGQGLAEYLVIVILVAIGVLIALRVFGGSISEKFETATEQVTKLETGAESTIGVGSGESGTKTQSSDTGKSQSGSSGGSSSEGKSESSGKSGASGGSGGNQSLSSKVDELKPDPVGGGSGSAFDDIQLSWGTLMFIGGIVCAVGVYIVMRVTSDDKKKKEKKPEKKAKKKMFSLGKRGGGGGGAESGQAMVEFVLSAITFFFCILGVLQLALCLNAYALVRYAAYNAARAGSVHGGDKDVMQDAARISLLAVFPKHGVADHRRGITENYLAAKATDTDTANTYYNEPITEVNIINNNGVGGGELITFDDSAQTPKQTITVQVIHRYELVIPLVNRILFYVYTRFREAGGYSGESLNFLSATTDKMRRTGDFKDIEYRIPLISHYTIRLQSDYQAS